MRFERRFRSFGRRSTRRRTVLSNAMVFERCPLKAARNSARLSPHFDRHIG